MGRFCVSLLDGKGLPVFSAVSLVDANLRVRRKVKLTGGSSAGSSVLDEEERIYRELQADSDRLQLRSSKFVPWQSFA